MKHVLSKLGSRGGVTFLVAIAWVYLGPTMFGDQSWGSSIGDPIAFIIALFVDATYALRMCQCFRKGEELGPLVAMFSILAFVGWCISVAIGQATDYGLTLMGLTVSASILFDGLISALAEERREAAAAQAVETSNQG